MTAEELLNTSNENLVTFFKRGIQLDAQNGGNGKNPFDIEQLQKELIRRLNNREDSKNEFFQSNGKPNFAGNKGNTGFRTRRPK